MWDGAAAPECGPRCGRPTRRARVRPSDAMPVRGTGRRDGRIAECRYGGRTGRRSGVVVVREPEAVTVRPCAGPAWWRAGQMRLRPNLRAESRRRDTPGIRDDGREPSRRSGVANHRSAETVTARPTAPPRYRRSARPSRRARSRPPHRSRHRTGDRAADRGDGQSAGDPRGTPAAQPSDVPHARPGRGSNHRARDRRDQRAVRRAPRWSDARSAGRRPGRAADPPRAASVGRPGHRPVARPTR